MGEEDKVTEVAATVSNGTTPDADKLVETATDNNVDGKDGVNKMEGHGKDETNIEKMDIDEPGVKQSKESKTNGEEDQEEKDENKEQEKEVTKIEAKEEKSEAQADEGKEDAVDDKLDASKEDKDQPKEEKKGEEDKEGEVDEEDKEGEVDEEDKEGEVDEEDKEGEVDKEEKREEDTKKHAKAKSTGKKDKKEVVGKKKEGPKTPLVSSTDRPVRERKSVERLVASIEKETVRELHIEKGRGTALKDIPNVAHKLSKRKTDETCKTLHTILFGRRGKAAQIRSNISRFSGFVWHENEEKQRLKVKEKFDKCVKEKLLDFCDVLDIPIARSTTKKEDIVTKLIDFLVAPHVTNPELLAEMEQSSKGKKRKRVSKESGSTSRTPSKGSAKQSQRSGNATKGGRKKVAAPKQDDLEEDDDEEEREEEEEHEEENINGIPENSDDEMPEHDENESEDESEEERERQKPSSKKSSAKESIEKVRMKKNTTPTKPSRKPKKTPMKSQSGRLKVNNNSDSSPKILLGKKKDEVVTKKKSANPEKAATKEKSGKKVVRGKDKPKEEKLKLSDEDLLNAIREILKEVDFNTATFTDILKQLAKQFNTDLTPRKSSIKLLIQDELTKLADEAEDEDDEIDTENDGKPPSGQGVAA